jgi:hypothetical protein
MLEGSHEAVSQAYTLSRDVNDSTGSQLDIESRHSLFGGTMRSVVLTLALILALCVNPAGSGSKPISTDLPDIDTSRGFLEMCEAVDKKPQEQSQVELFRSGYCIGWMAGLTKGIHVAQTIHQTTEKNAVFCPPAGNSYGQMIHIARKFIADHPEMEHLSMGVIVAAALAEAFPCKESK